MQDDPDAFPPEALPPATAIVRAGDWKDAFEVVALTFDERFLRRKRFETVHQETFSVNLPQTTPVDHGDAFVLADGRLIEVIAAAEPLLEVTGPQLAELAWHIGNCHAACQVEPDRLLIRQDHALAARLAQVGAGLRAVSEPFTPLAGDHGPGPVTGHDHAATPNGPAVLSRTGRVQHIEPEPLPAGGPFDDPPA